MIFLLLGVLTLVIGGCVCVVWAERGGPRWVRIVAALTRGAGELVSSAQKNRSRGSGDTDGD
ncbi:MULTISPECIES: hypothetical protein [unclassified Streptomyces]|uniref:hypothetical protein n=1 Tax=unclassified Streptomyces TaxID=2593676 RepID=UPI0004CAC815|nr:MULTISPECIES: hypothetical protein [unclassified Streptomyces]KOV78966.1 hypothetical protein ADL02_24220 [Streptomyces sp. NRRL WC-3723]